MHQPYYGDDLAKKIKMPWVFLHAIKDYYDMPLTLSRYDGIKATFNLVPSLLIQIESYGNKTANDELLLIIQEDVELLDEAQRKKLEEYLFLSHEEHAIKPLWRYHELYTKFLASSRTLEVFDSQEIVDSEVLFLLSWCGNHLRSADPLIKNLLLQGANFTHKQKNDLIDTLLDFCKEIIPLYKKLALEGKIELSTTPFYHPIAPLLLDIHSAKEANPNTLLPSIECDFASATQFQTSEAIAYFHRTFGFYPKGFWPAEGSVSMATLDLFARHKIAWIGTDEEILFRSIGSNDKNLLYDGYKDQKSKISVLFRDKYLSDLIGFEYSRQDPKKAVKDFILELQKIALHKGSNGIVSVILDGENAWEYYPHNGLDFFDTLYSELQNNSTLIETIVASQIVDLPINHKEIASLATGSWINGNFDIWIGKKQKNQAWELLCQTQKMILASHDSLTPQIEEMIKNELMIALGSDWFWWYDDDHFTVQKRSFDDLFRLHLSNIYTLLGKEIPKNISDPIVMEDRAIQTPNGAMHKTTPNTTTDPLFRYCKLAQQWVLFAPSRAKRPHNVESQNQTTHETICPFDHGNEDLTPPEIERIERDGNWSVRVVPNLYNVLSIDIEPIGKRDEYFDLLSGFGAHEVVIETPNHHTTIFDYEVDEFVDYLTLCKNRVASLKKDTRLLYVSLFKNRGPQAGASQSHEHSQIIALPFVPKDIQEEIGYKKEYYTQYKRALLDDMVYEEKKYETNFIFENESFVCYAPYASRFPYEVRIVAKKKIATIIELDDTQMIHLAEALELLFGKYKGCLGEFAFTMIFKNHPYENYTGNSKEYYRFSIHIYPRLSGIAGFELDSGIYINSVLPSEVATQLRNA